LNNIKSQNDLIFNKPKPSENKKEALNDIFDNLIEEEVNNRIEIPLINKEEKTLDKSDISGI
jgi:hypothetical protein